MLLPRVCPRVAASLQRGQGEAEQAPAVGVIEVETEQPGHLADARMEGVPVDAEAASLLPLATRSARE